MNEFTEVLLNTPREWEDEALRYVDEMMNK
jgi:hypothetical protein